MGCETGSRLEKERAGVVEGRVGNEGRRPRSMEGRVGSTEGAVSSIDDGVRAEDGRVRSEEGAVGSAEGAVAVVERRISNIDGRVRAEDGRVGSEDGVVGSEDGGVGSEDGGVWWEDGGVGCEEGASRAVEGAGGDEGGWERTARSPVKTVEDAPPQSEAGVAGVSERWSIVLSGGHFLDNRRAGRGRCLGNEAGAFGWLPGRFTSR